MRTTAEATHVPATAPREQSGRRRGPGSGEAADDANSAPEAISAATTVTVTATRMLRVDEGLYALRIGELDGASSEIAGMALPAAQVSAPFAGDGNGVEIVAAYPGKGNWIGRSGGTLILRSTASAGYVIVTAYGGSGAAESNISLDLRRLDGAGGALEEVSAAALVGGGAQGSVREVPTEILLHIERAGDRLFPGRGWVGALGRRMRIEAFSIRPTERLAPADIEMKGFLPNGGETPWIPGGLLCGTRGRGLPLIGFALRVTPQRADRFEVNYQGSFFSGGISETQRNGAPCRSTGDDPLEAVNVRFVEHLVDPQDDEETTAEPAV